MNNQEYLDTFDEVRDLYKKLHTMRLDPGTGSHQRAD